MIELAETQQATDFSALQARYDGLSGSDLLRPMMELEFHRKIALVSSFGTEAAVLLALAAEIDPGSDRVSAPGLECGQGVCTDAQAGSEGSSWRP